MSGLTIGGKAANDPGVLRQIMADWRRPAEPGSEVPVVVPRSTAYPTQQAAVAQLKAWLDEAFALDAAAEAAERKRLVLAERLADPDLFDHPKRHEALARYEELVRECGAAKGRLEALLWLMGRTWEALGGVGRSLLVEEQWPTQGTAADVRAYLEGCIAAKWKPVREVPFALLIFWLAAAMVRIPLG